MGMGVADGMLVSGPTSSITDLAKILDALVDANATTSRADFEETPRAFRGAWRRAFGPNLQGETHTQRRHLAKATAGSKLMGPYHDACEKLTGQDEDKQFHKMCYIGAVTFTA